MKEQVKNIVIDGVEYITFKCYADEHGKTYESARGKVAQLIKKGRIKEDDVLKIGGTRFLSPVAVQELEKVERSVVVVDDGLKQELYETKKLYADLLNATSGFAEVINKQREDIMRLQENNLRLLMENKEQQARIELLEDKQKKGFFGRLFNRP